MMIMHTGCAPDISFFCLSYTKYIHRVRVRYIQSACAVGLSLLVKENFENIYIAMDQNTVCCDKKNVFIKLRISY